MKKIAAIFLLFAIMTVFVSCGKNQKEDETTLSAYLGTSATTSQKSEESTTAESKPNGYILTTDPNLTVSWGLTTAFQTTLPTSVPLSTTPVPSITDNLNSTAINPNMSQVSTTEKPSQTVTTGQQGPTVVDAPDNTTKPAKPEEEETTEAVTKEEKIVAVGAKSFSGDYKSLTIDFNANGWDGAIATRSTKVTVSYGSKTEKAPCTIKSGEITIDASGLEITSGATVTVNIPEGAITTSSGSQYNRAFSITVTA